MTEGGRCWNKYKMTHIWVQWLGDVTRWHGITAADAVGDQIISVLRQRNTFCTHAQRDINVFCISLCSIRLVAASPAVPAWDRMNMGWVALLITETPTWLHQFVGLLRINSVSTLCNRGRREGLSPQQYFHPWNYFQALQSWIIFSQ